jgi:ectoine hydroxylase-related dioxygenase (phytanoyl-CoA dioxygenase family)
MIETRYTTPENLSEEKVQAYRQDGFVHIPGAISADEVVRFREAVLEYAGRSKDRALKYDSNVFTQLVNVWREDETVKQLTLHPNLGALAERLAGKPLRLWHDQTLIKVPHSEAATEFHQDQPYWPHANSPDPLSAWVALVDVPVERGCMTFIPGSQGMADLEAQDLQDAASLFSLAPNLVWEPRVTIPLKAGDCTFHHGRTAHMATPNFTDDPRVAHVSIFMDASTTYVEKPHVVTDPLGLKEGQPLEGEMFPRVGKR